MTEHKSYFPQIKYFIRQALSIHLLRPFLRIRYNISQFTGHWEPVVYLFIVIALIQADESIDKYGKKRNIIAHFSMYVIICPIPSYIDIDMYYALYIHIVVG